MNLGDQLKNRKNVNKKTLTGKSKVSLLFDPKNAQDMDLDAIYSIGYAGWLELNSLDKRFFEFEDFFFTDSAKNYNRYLKTKEENKDLDMKISKFLRLLSPFLALKPALKVFEWLLRRFEIQNFNIDAVMICMIPYHETKLFAKILHIMDMKNHPVWQFASSAAEKSLHLDRQTIVQQFIKNSKFATLICEAIENAVKNQIAHPKLFEFFGKTFIEVLHSMPSDINKLVNFLPLVVFGCSQKLSKDFQLISYMILAQICDLNQLSEMVCQGFVDAIITNTLDFDKCLLCLLKIYQSQEAIKSLPVKLLKILISNNLFQKLENLPFEICLDRFLKALIPSLLDETEFDGSIHEFYIKFGSPSVLNFTFKQIFENIAKGEKIHASIVSFLYQRFGKEFDHHLDSFLSENNSNMIVEFLKENNIGTHGDFNHSQKVMRLDYVKQFFSSPDLDNTDIQNIVDILDNEDSSEVLKELLENIGQDFVKENFSKLILLAKRLKEVEVLEICLKKILLATNPNETHQYSQFLTLLIPLENENFKNIFDSFTKTEIPPGDEFLNELKNFNAKDAGSKNYCEKLGLLLTNMNGYDILMEKLFNFSPKAGILLLSNGLKCDAQVSKLLKNVLNFPLSSSLTHYNQLFATNSASSKNSEQSLKIYALEKIKYYFENIQLNFTEINIFETIKGEKTGLLLEYFSLLCMHQNNPFCRDLLKSFLKIFYPYELEFLLGALNAENLQRNVKIIILNFVSFYIKKNKFDYQTIFPHVLIQLTSEDEQIRHLSLEIIQKIHDYAVLEKLQIFHLSNIYHSKSSELRHLEKKSFQKFLGKFLSQQNMIKLNSSQASDVLKNIFNEKNFDGKTLMQYFCSHILACDSIAFRSKMLNILDTISPSLKIKYLEPMFSGLLENTTDHRTALLSQLLFSMIVPESIQYIFEKPKLSKMFKNLLNMFESNDHSEVMQKIKLELLQNISSESFSYLPLTIQNKIFTILVSLTFTENEALRSLGNKHIIEYNIYSNVIIQEMGKILNEIQPSDQPSEKRRKIIDNEKTIQNLIIYLEILLKKSNVLNQFDLIPSLFEVINILLSLKSRENLISEIEYALQLALSNLQLIIQKITKQCSNPATQEQNIRVELVAKCIQISENPQTRNNALLLMGIMAEVYPEKVLHNVMPVFTFMGTNVLRHDDNHTFHVIFQTLQALIPCLVSKYSAMQSKIDRILPLKTILNVFIHSFHHIPKHRRLKLFVILTETLGEQYFLDFIITMLLRSFDNQKKSNIVDENIFEFVVVLINQFDSLTQLQILYSIIQNVQSFPVKYDPENIPSIFRLFDIENQKDLFSVTRSCLSFVSTVIGDRFFLAKLTSSGLLETQTRDESYIGMIESILDIIHKWNNSLEQNMNETEMKKVELIVESSYKTIEGINSLVSIPHFMNIVNKLIVNDDYTIRKKAISLFNSRLLRSPEVTKAEFSGIFIKFVSHLNKIACSKTEKPVVVQNALVGIGLLTRNFGSIETQVFQDSFDFLISSYLFEDSSLNEIKISFFACLSAMIESLKINCLGSFNKLMPKIIQSLQNCIKDSLVFTAVLTCLNSLVTTLPHFMTNYLPKLVIPLLKSVKIQPKGSEIVESILESLASSLEPRVLFPQIFSLLPEIFSLDLDSVVLFYKMVKVGIVKLNKENLLQHYKPLFKFFLDSFDIDRFTKISFESRNSVEMEIIDSFSNMVMKMNEQLFKPIFLKIVDWSNEEVRRRPFFYKLIHQLLIRFKTIFASFFIYILDNIYTLLTNGVDFSIWTYIMDSLQLAFLYESDGLLSQEKVLKIVQPLVLQLEHVLLKEDYLSLIEKHFIPAIGQIAVYSKSHQAVLKQVNHLVLMETRHDKSLVRMAALKVIKEFYTKMGEDFLVYLPETIPFLAELMEDNDEDVEKLTREVISIVEELLGESLQDHLK